MRHVTVLISLLVLFALAMPVFAFKGSSEKEKEHKSFSVKEKSRNSDYQGGLNSEYQKMFDKAVNQFEAKDYDESIQLLTKVILEYPGYIPAYKTRGLAFMEKGKITKNRMDADDVTYNKSIYEYKRAVRNFTKIIELDPSLPYPYFYRGASYVELDYYAMPALDDLNKYINDHNSGTIDAHYYRGVAYLQRGNLAEAETELKKVIDMDPKRTDAYASIMKAFDTLENYDDAISYFGSLANRYQDNATPWFYRGLAYLQQENYVKAVSDFDMAIVIYPDYAEARRMRKEAVRDSYR